MKKIIFITGSSKGLGLELAEAFLNLDWIVVGISRSNKIKHPNFYFLKNDLSTESKLTDKIEKLLEKNKLNQKYSEVVLINNAAMVLPINYAHKISEKDIRQSYQLNLHSPMILSQWLISKFLKKSVPLTICNLSSGAALRPIVNWSIYCTMKSALKMFTDCLQQDYAAYSHFKVFSFYPGVMDTSMQATIRKQKASHFKNVEYFKDLKEKNNLLPASKVAKVISQILSRPNEICKIEYNIKDFMHE